MKNRVPLNDVEVRWSVLIESVFFGSMTIPPEELSDYDAERLINAGNNVLCRLQEMKDKSKGH